MNPKERNTNKSKAGIYGLTAVSPQTIAYACVQVNYSLPAFFLLTKSRKTYIALSDIKQWGWKVKLFYLNDFYDNIVSTFQDNAESPWVQETLEWWNK